MERIGVAVEAAFCEDDPFHGMKITSLPKSTREILAVGFNEAKAEHVNTSMMKEWDFFLFLWLLLW